MYMCILIVIVYHFIQVTSELIFNMIRYEDRGRYRCVADNIHTNVTTSEYAEIRITRKLIQCIGLKFVRWGLDYHPVSVTCSYTIVSLLIAT